MLPIRDSSSRSSPRECSFWDQACVRPLVQLVCLPTTSPPGLKLRNRPTKLFFLTTIARILLLMHCIEPNPGPEIPLRILTINVTSLLPNLHLLEGLDADIICLQETKLTGTGQRLVRNKIRENLCLRLWQPFFGRVCAGRVDGSNVSSTVVGASAGVAILVRKGLPACSIPPVSVCECVCVFASLLGLAELPSMWPPSTPTLVSK